MKTQVFDVNGRKIEAPVGYASFKDYFEVLKSNLADLKRSGSERYAATPLALLITEYERKIQECRQALGH